MKQVVLLACALVLVASVAGAQARGIDFKRSNNRIAPGPLYVVANTTASIAPAITAANWTCGAGWDCSVAGTLNKNADGVGTATPTAAMGVTAGVTYEVTITVGAVSVASGATYTLGGTPGREALAAATTYTHHITANTTANLIITPTPTATRFTITSVSVKPLVDATGDGYFDGNVWFRSPIYPRAQILSSAGSATIPMLASAATPGTGYSASASATQIVIGNVARWNFNTGYFYADGTAGVGTAGTATVPMATGYFQQGIQSSKVKALTDAAAATPVIRVPVATAGFQAGKVLWNAQSTDGTDHRTTTGTIAFAGVNKAGTPTCTVGVIGTDLTASSNGNTLVCTWTNVVSTTNCDLSVTCTDDTAGSQTMTINVRPDMPTTATLVFP